GNALRRGHRRRGAQANRDDGRLTPDPGHLAGRPGPRGQPPFGSAGLRNVGRRGRRILCRSSRALSRCRRPGRCHLRRYGGGRPRPAPPRPPANHRRGAGTVRPRGAARHGWLNDRSHASAAAEYIAATGYAGGDRYVDERAVVDGDLITAGPQSPVQFARATVGRPGLAPTETLEAYEGVFPRADPAAFPALMQSRGAT